MKIIYFAKIREIKGKKTEKVDIPDNISTIEQLLFYLTTLGEEYNHALNDINKIHVACDQEYVGNDFNFKDCQEIAIFPPVTGG